MAEPVVTKIICTVLDWTIRQPVAINLPIDSKILCVLYHHNYDHLYCLSSCSKEKETRYFIVKQAKHTMEPIQGKEYKYIGSTVDEDSVSWHIFELVNTEVHPTETKRKGKH